MKKKPNPCVLCDYARMRRDICGIYCTGGFQKPDGACDHFQEYRSRSKTGKAEVSS
jgi:hypothetical protein